MFIGRNEELNQIKRRLNISGFQAVLVYGKRRVGKTELINEAINSTKVRCLSLLAREVNLSINLAEFSEEAGAFMHNAAFYPKDFYQFYSSLFEYSKNNPFVLFIDEYSFLKKADNSIDSYLQKAIELHKNNCNITIVLCGSYIEMMRGIVEKNAPLYHRFNEEILLHAFDYYDSAKFMNKISLDDKFKYYAVFGGTAFNLKNIDYNISFEENVINELIKKDSFFEKEAISTIKSEIEKEENVNTIFELVAKGIRTYKEINDIVGDPSKDNISRYIKKLVDMDLIDKSYQVNSKSERKSLYYIKDNLLDFYYTFIFKYQRIRSFMPPKVFFDNYVKKELEEKYLPRKFEEIIKEFAIRNNATKVPLFTSIGRLYYNDKNINREFDVVMLVDGKYLPIECKYSKSLVGLEALNEERYQWRDTPFEVIKYGFASKSGFKEELKKEDVLLITLEDIYN